MDTCIYSDVRAGPSALLSCLFHLPGGAGTGESDFSMSAGTSARLPIAADLLPSGSFLPVATRGCKDHGQLSDLGAARAAGVKARGERSAPEGPPCPPGEATAGSGKPRTAGKHSRGGACVGGSSGQADWQCGVAVPGHPEQHPLGSPPFCLPEPVTPEAATGQPETLPAPCRQSGWV